MAKIGEAIGADIITAMKAREADKLTTLRMVKSALRSKEIDKREPLTEAEEQAILTTLLKQRRESYEAFTKGGRPELAAKEQVEIGLIEGYMPRAAAEDDIRDCDRCDRDPYRRCRRPAPRAQGHGHGHARGAAEDTRQRLPRRWEDGERDGEGGAGEGLVLCSGKPLFVGLRESRECAAGQHTVDHLGPVPPAMMVKLTAKALHP